MKKTSYIIGLAAAAAVFAGCAKSTTLSSNETTKSFIEDWISINYPGTRSSGRGIYILEDTPGTGDIYNGETFAILDYTTSSLDGTISSSTIKEICQRIGTYDKTEYYGPRVLTQIDENGGVAMQIGIQDLLDGMRIGETRKALVPSWLMGYKTYDDPEEYIKHTVSQANTLIYEITLRGFTEDINTYQKDSIERFNAINKLGLTSLDDGFYYKEIKAPTDTNAFRSDTTIYINYTGRLLNGQVFDTTIEDTAKMYGIYSSSKTYAPVLINWGENYTDLTMSTDQDDIVDGFQRLLWQMRRYGRSIAVFSSGWGYGRSGKGTIPAYCPLLFDVEITDEK